MAHVRVAIRAHPKQAELIKSLVWGLRGQADRLPLLQVDFIIVPTEPDSLHLLSHITNGDDNNPATVCSRTRPLPEAREDL
jgi:hypothetical protein